MDIKQQIKKLLQEAEIYRSQGLLVEAKAKYKEVAAIITNNEQIKSRQSLIEGINKKIKTLNKDLTDFVKAPSSVEVPKEVQDLIKKQFAFASDDKDEDTVALEGAVALAKFGQYQRAIQDLSELLEKESVKIAAAKNILRCHIAHTSAEEAVSQYESWFSENRFTPSQTKKICRFLEDFLNKKGINQTLSQVEEAAPALSDTPFAIDKPEEEKEEEEYIDISSITIYFEDGPRKGDALEFDVNFQSENVISILFSRKEKSLVENFNVGLTLNNVQFVSPIAIFSGSGVVTEKTEISSGPRKGDYSMDIKIQSAS